MIRLELALNPRYLLIVGSGKPDELMSVDEVFTRKIRVYHIDGKLKDKNVFYIPGSTLKGVLRTSASRVATLLGLSACGEINPTLIRNKHREMDNLVRIEDKRVCHVCMLFGFPGGPRSPLRISDGEFIDLYIDNFTRVAIDDKRNISKIGALFTYEEALFQSLVRFEIQLLRNDLWMQRLLLASLVEMVFNGIGKGCGISLRLEKSQGLNLEDKIVSHLHNLLVKGVEL